MATDLSKNSDEQVLALINADNAINLNFTHISFAVPSSLQDDPENKNTQLTVSSVVNSGYKGSVDIKYNRLNLNGFLSYGEPIVVIPIDGDINDILDGFNELYGSNLDFTDIPFGMTLPAIDYEGKEVVLNALTGSYAFIGSITIFVKWPTEDLSTIIPNYHLIGLEFPPPSDLSFYLQTPIIDGIDIL